MLKPSVWQKAKQITSYFEGWLSGNFDGQYLSYGYLQWSFGQGTLQPLFRRLFCEFPQTAQSTLPGGGNDLIAALNSGTERAWALQIQKNNTIIDPWLTEFRSLYSTSEWQQIMDEAAGWYKNKAVEMCCAFNLRTDRAFCLAFDIAVQNGGLDYYEMEEAAYQDRLISWAAVASDKSDARWRQDVLARKMAIVKGKDMGRGWCGEVFDDGDAFGEVETLTGKEILKALADAGKLDSLEKWDRALEVLSGIPGGIGDLEVLKYTGTLIEKVYAFGKGED